MASGKIVNPIVISKRRKTLFKKAHELAVLCGAEIAIIIISADGKIYEYGSTSVKQTLARFEACKEPKPMSEPKPKPKKPAEEEVRKRKGKELAVVPQHKLKSRKVLGMDLTQMSLDELSVLEEKLKTGIELAKNKKLQVLTEELQESNNQRDKVEEENKMLLRQVEELRGSIPRPIYNPLPISINLPSMSFAAPPQLAITSGPQTEANLQDEINTL